MDKRKPILVNQSEKKTEEILKNIVKKHNVEVRAKIRVADVLSIEKTDQETNPLFAVEFDGKSHSDKETITRDRLKNSICKKLGMPLLRINSTILQEIGTSDSVLSWLIEVWFANKAFCEAQNNNEIPSDEVFYWGLMLKYSYVENGKFKQIDDDNLEKIVMTSFDHFTALRAKLLKWKEKNLIENFAPEVMLAENFDNITKARAFVKLKTGDYILGQASCQFFYFDSITTGELAEELAVADLVVRIQKYIEGNYQASNFQTIKAFYKEMSKWKDFRVVGEMIISEQQMAK